MKSSGEVVEDGEPAEQPAALHFLEMEGGQRKTDDGDFFSCRIKNP
jgi:hypothetical protein